MTTLIEPEELAPGRGYSNGIVLRGNRTLFVAGQIGWDRNGVLVSEQFAPQFGQALKNVVAVVREAGGKPEHVGQLRIFVTDKQLYLHASKAVGEAYREQMGRHYPAMALVEVKALLLGGALVEIEAVAILPDEAC